MKLHTVVSIRMGEINKWKKITVPIPFPMKEVHIYLYKGPNGYVLVDAGAKTDIARALFEAELEKLHLTCKDIAHVVITHHHPDHIGLIDYFTHRFNLYGSKRMIPWLLQEKIFFDYYKLKIKSYAEKLGVPEEFIPAAIDTTDITKYGCIRKITHPLEDGDRLDEILPGYEVINMPGHASTHIVLYNRKEDIMIGGDILLDRVSSNPLIEAPLPYEGEKRKSLMEYEESLWKLYDLNPSVILPGHGKYIKNVRELIESRIQKRKNRTELIEQYIDEKKINQAYELCHYLFPKHTKHDLFLVLSEIVGHLEMLESEGNEKARRLIQHIIHV